MFQALKAAVVAMFFVIEKFAVGLVNLASAFEQSTKAVEVYATTLIPTDEQTEAALKLANDNRDLNLETQAAKIKEAQDKLAAAKAKRQQV